MTNKRIWLVVQHQSDSDEFDNRTVYTCASQEIAEYAAAKLNKQYACNVELDDDNLFVDIKDTELDWHYYEVESSAIEETRQDIDEYDLV